MSGENTLVYELARRPEYLIQSLSHSQLPSTRCVCCLIEVFPTERLTQLLKVLSWYGKLGCVSYLGHLGDSFVQGCSSEPCTQCEPSITGTQKNWQSPLSFLSSQDTGRNPLQGANPPFRWQRLSSYTAGGKTPGCLGL